MTFGSLFTGINGMGLGFERAGFRSMWHVEWNQQCRKLLAKRCPGVELRGDVRTDCDGLAAVDVMGITDPCPKHSRARSNGESVHPDLSGYGLALVGRLRPRWVVRENVPAPTVAHFDAALAALGYGTAVIRMDSSALTGQSRQRDFIVGRYQATRASVRRVFSDCSDGPGAYTTRLGTGQVTPALTTHRTRYDSRDCYVYEPAGLRILDCEERERLAGFPEGWTAGFSPATRARMCGNSVVPQISEYIGRRILEAN